VSHLASSMKKLIGDTDICLSTIIKKYFKRLVHRLGQTLFADKYLLLQHSGPRSLFLVVTNGQSMNHSSFCSGTVKQEEYESTLKIACCVFSGFFNL